MKTPIVLFIWQRDQVRADKSKQDKK